VFAYVCTPGFEGALADELGASREDVVVPTPGIVRVREDAARLVAPQTSGPTPAPSFPLDPVFARQALPGARPVSAPSIAKLAAGIFDLVADPLDQASRFVVHAFVPIACDPSLGSRARLVREAVLELLKAKRRRAFRRLLTEDEAVAPASSPWWAVQILMLDSETVWLSVAEARPLRWGSWDLSPWPAGAAPVARDRTPPSRAYQKAEEAYQWMGAAPAAGERVVDLGGAPGGWSYTALRRGAEVLAVDRAPLEPPVKGHPKLVELQGDAFRYAPPAPVDWLLCDVIAEPQRSLALVAEWMEKGWARNLVVTIKFKGTGAYGLLAGLGAVFEQNRPVFARAKHLAHNKNEVTVMVRR
jgi:23S rRNA (cytidine2498-2'-O)-methyltransferase